MKLNIQQLALVVVGIAVGTIATTLFFVLSNRTRPAPIIIQPASATMTPQATPTPQPAQVYVNGAVNQPGVYGLAPGAILQDAIDAAGGFAPDAEADFVNLAQPVMDGMQLYVPGVGEDETTRTQQVPVVTLPNSAPAAGGQGDSVQPGDVININTATVGELDTLPGIGPSTAQKIVDYRDENGPFDSAEAVMNVSGIGEAKFDQIAPFITVGP